MKRDQKSAKLVVLDNNDPITAETEEIQARIRQRAFELSHRRPPDAHELYDWIAAESEVISVPPVELLERDGMFDVKFAVAGVQPDDVNIMVTSDQILLKSQFTHQHDAGSGTVHLCDFKSATVFRSIQLPQPIDVNTVKVDFEEGMVHVSAAKQGSAEEPPKRAPAMRKAPAKKSRSKQP
ncbi:MAG TPA: Hsp20/alpha crystallin family protein [Terriglobia bacterium]|jgi:HSP20 family molecular chaperone IbpA